jgi:hypothetical protein
MSKTSGAVDWPFCDLAAATSSALEPFGFAELIVIFGYFFSNPAMILP